MAVTLGVMTVIIAALVFALYKAIEIRKVDIETLLALNYVEFECLQILVANADEVGLVISNAKKR